VNYLHFSYTINAINMQPYYNLKGHFSCCKP